MAAATEPYHRKKILLLVTGPNERSGLIHRSELNAGIQFFPSVFRGTQK